MNINAATGLGVTSALMPVTGGEVDIDLVLPPAVPGEFIFTVTDTSGVTRDGGTLSTSRYPYAIKLPFDEAPTGKGTLRVQDLVTGTFMTAAYRVADEPIAHGRVVGGARWGDYGDTDHRIKTIHLDFRPTLLPNETRQFKLYTTGGSGDASGGITITTPAGQEYYEINTGPGGIIMRVPRKGAQTIRSYLKELVTNQVLIDDTLSAGKGGLWMLGTAANGQNVDFFSANDTSGDGLTNGGDWTEETRPSKYYTSVLFHTSEKACIKIDTVRCKTPAGVVFKGMNRTVGAGGSPTPMDAVWDVYHYFQRGSRAVRTVYWFKSSGGDYDNQGGSRADCHIDGMGDDVVTLFTGSMQMATRDETAATKIARTTSATAGIIRQRANPSAGGSYNFSLTKTGPIAFTGTPVTQLEAVYDVTMANGAAGLLRAPWNWRNKYPMGWNHAPATGRLRWEMLNPDQNDVYAAQNRDYHVILGHQWFSAEEYLVAHPGVLTDQQITDTVKALVGVFEEKTIANGWQAGTQTGKGAQQTSLLGHCGSDGWDRARVWKRLPPPTINRPDLLGTPGTILGLAGILPGNTGTSKVEDTLQRLDRWMDTYHVNENDGLGNTQRGWRGYQAVPNSARTGPLGHREYGGHPTSGSFDNCGSNDYEYASYPIYHWLRRNDRGDFSVGIEATLHCIALDQFHNLYGQATSADGMHGIMMDFNGHATTFHSSNRASGFEYQQNFEAPSLMYLVTGEPWFLEALYHAVNAFNNKLYGYDASSTYFNCASRGGPVTGVMAGNNIVLSTDPIAAGFRARNVPFGGSPVTAFPFQAYPLAGNGTLSSSGDVITCTADLPGYAAGATFGAHPDTAAYFENYEQYVGAAIRAPRTTGQEYKVIGIAAVRTFYNGVADGVNGVNAVFQYVEGPITSAAQITVVTFTNPNGGAPTLRTLNVHYTVTNMGPSGATITFTAGNIPASGSAIKIWDFRRRLRVTPTPSPALNGADWEWLFHTGQSANWGSINAIVGNTLQCSWTFGAPTNGSTVQVWSNPVGLLRLEGWQLATLIGFAKCIGQFAVNAQGSHDLYERIKDSASHILFTEQLRSSQGAKDQMGGAAAWTSVGYGWVGGRFGGQGHTYFGYGAQPVLYAAEFGDLMAAAGFGAIFTPAFNSSMLELCVRYCKAGAMGVDGLSPIRGSQWNQLRRYPVGRGLDLASPTSFQPFASPFSWYVVEEPTRAARQRTDFLKSADSMNDLWNSGPVQANVGNGGDAFMNSSGAASVATFLADLVAYCAEKKYHATGDTVRRDLWLKTAMEMGLSSLCFNAEVNPAFGSYVNPATYAVVDGMFASNGAVAGGIRAKHWALKHHGYWMRAARYPIDGWPS